MAKVFVSYASTDPAASGLGAGRFVQLIVVLGIVVVVVPFGWTKSVEPGTVTTTPRSLPLPDLVEIPGGVFMMGSEQGDDDETPVRAVTIDAPFYLSAAEITFEQYDAFAAATKSKFPDASAWGRGDRPVINVSWDEATAYARWLDTMTGSGCRLPSDTEWEYATRAGTETRFALRHSTDDPWGTDDLAGLANCRDCGPSSSLTYEEKHLVGERTLLVGSFGPNEFGLRDMHGNVWEWVESCYDNVADDTACERRVLRGGSWYDFQNYARSANRSFNDPYDRSSFVGFRVLCSSPIP